MEYNSWFKEITELFDSISIEHATEGNFSGAIKLGGVKMTVFFKNFLF